MKICDECLKVESNLDGNDIGMASNLDSAEDCLEACKNYAGCHGFTYLLDHDTCYFKSDAIESLPFLSTPRMIAAKLSCFIV